jgi:cell division protein FtsQ
VGRPQLPADLADATSFERISQPAPEPIPAFERPPSKVAAVARALFGIALVVGLSGAAAFGARRYVTTTPRFAVTQIDVTGNARRTPADIASTAGVEMGANVFTADLDRAKARLLADPWIREASLARRLPGKISIQVAERDAAAIVALGDSYLASRDGEIFKRLEAGDPTDLPVVTGLSPDAVAEDRDAAMRSVKRALDLVDEYGRSAMAQRSPLQEVHVADDGGYSMVVGKSGLSLALGAPPFHRKLDEAARVVAELDRRGAKPGAILLDNEAHPERVVVRVR